MGQENIACQINIMGWTMNLMTLDERGVTREQIEAFSSVTNTTPWPKRLYLWSHYGAFLRFLWSNYGANKHKKCTFMEHFKIVNVCCFYIQIPINISTNVLTFYFLGFQKGTLFLGLKLNHCSLLLFVSCVLLLFVSFGKLWGFWKIM